jgi:hypothetical protein
MLPYSSQLINGWKGSKNEEAGNTEICVCGKIIVFSNCTMAWYSKLNNNYAVQLVSQCEMLKINSSPFEATAGSIQDFKKKNIIRQRHVTNYTG